MVKINAPYILSLAFKGYSLWHELVLLNVSSVIKAELDYSKNLGHQHEEMHEEMLKRLILSLGHVKELGLKVGESCLEALACLQAKGFIFPSNLKLLQEIDSD
nr:hypothetical protein [Tanacetum cinerariifolium]